MSQTRIFSDKVPLYNSKAWEKSPVFIHVVSASVGATTKKYRESPDGLSVTEVWSRDHGNTVYAVAVDSDGNVYTAGNRTSQVFADANDGGQRVTTRKYDSSGTLLWSRDHGIDIFSIGVDRLGNVYTIGSVVSSATFRKYDSSGTLLWSRNTASQGLAIDKEGNIYVGSPLRKYSTNGNRLWQAQLTTGNMFAIALDKKYIYAGLNKRSLSGNRKEWNTGLAGITSDLAIDIDGNIYVGFSTVMRKISPDGDILLLGGSSFIQGGRGVACDKRGNVYTTVNANLSPTIINGGFIKYDSSGTLLWSISHGTVNNISRIALSTNVSTLPQWN